MADGPPAYKGAKSAGKVIVGITTFVMVVILVSGIVIWIPRTRKALRNRLVVSCTKGWWRFWYDSHVSLGIYVTLFLLVMALTGLTWSFQWYRTAAYGLFGVSTARPAMSAPQQQNKDEKKEKAEFDYGIWDNVVSELQALYPSYASISLTAGKHR